MNISSWLLGKRYTVFIFTVFRLLENIFMKCPLPRHGIIISSSMYNNPSHKFPAKVLLPYKSLFFGKKVPSSSQKKSFFSFLFHIFIFKSFVCHIKILKYLNLKQDICFSFFLGVIYTYLKGNA